MMNQVIVPYLMFFIYKVLFWTWKIKIVESQPVQELLAQKQPFIIAHWHGDELGILHLLKKYHVACIISTSKDGDIMNKAVQLLGAETVRGSSTRGGTQALKGMIQLKKRGRRPSVAVDGPKGPIYKVKPGIFQISRLTQLPITTLSFYSDRSHTFHKAWNKTQLPLPFAHVTVKWGEEIIPAVSRDKDPRTPELAKQLEDQLNQTKNEAKQLGQSLKKQ